MVESIASPNISFLGKGSGLGGQARGQMAVKLLNRTYSTPLVRLLLTQPSTTTTIKYKITIPTRGHEPPVSCGTQAANVPNVENHNGASHETFLKPYD